MRKLFEKVASVSLPFTAACKNSERQVAPSESSKAKRDVQSDAGRSGLALLFIGEQMKRFYCKPEDEWRELRSWGSGIGIRRL